MIDNIFYIVLDRVAMKINVIERWISESGLSKKHISRETGIGTSALTKYIRFEVYPNTKTLYKLLSELNKSEVRFTPEEYYNSRGDLNFNAKLILTYCAKNDLSISDFEKVTKVNYNTISMWLKGESYPSEQEKTKIILATQSYDFEEIEVMKECRSCNKKTIKEDYLFCPMCGFETNVEIECYSCNTKLNPLAKFCVACGCKVGSNKGRVNKEKVHKNVIDEDVIPEPSLGVTIEFKYSTAMNFDLVVDEAFKHPSFEKFGVGKKAIYRVNVPVSNILDLLKLTELLSPIRNKMVYLDGNKVDWYDTFSFFRCCNNKMSSYKPEYYCFGFDDDYYLNPWGCLHAGLSFNGYGSWSKWGRWLNDNGDWEYDKDRIRHELGRNLKHYKSCPNINFEFIEKVVCAIPDIVNPYKDKDWEFVRARRSGGDEDGIIVVTDDYGYKVENIMVGVAPKGKKAMKKIMKKVYKDKQLIMLTNKI